MNHLKIYEKWWDDTKKLDEPSGINLEHPNEDRKSDMKLEVNNLNIIVWTFFRNQKWNMVKIL